MEDAPTLVRPTISVVVIIAICMMGCVTRAQADEYQDQIAKAFKGFEVLARSDFTDEVQKSVKGNPALITGHFNRDKLEDFAAIIVDRSKQYDDKRGKKYYVGKYVVCHGAAGRRYQCHVLKEEHVHMPYEIHLRQVKPEKVECVTHKEPTVTQVTLKSDGIGWVLIDRGAGVFIYQADGLYWECSHPSD